MGNAISEGIDNVKALIEKGQSNENVADKINIEGKTSIDQPEKESPKIRPLRLYVLKLENDKYYVGTTQRTIEERYQEHVTGTGSKWTKLHKPLEIVERHDSVDKYDEDKYTKIYMSKYGIENVRGGTYSSNELMDFQIKSLKEEFCTSENRCFRCNEIGHFASECKNSRDRCYKCNREGHHAVDCKLGSDRCYKCNGFGHFAYECKNYPVKCYKCNGEGHVSAECKVSQIKCYKCDGYGHYAVNCKK